MDIQKTKKDNGQGLAIAGLVVGIFALLFSFIPCVGIASILFGATAIVFGSVAVNKATQNSSSKGMGIAGISLGSVAVLISIFWIVAIANFSDQFKDRFDSFDDFTNQFDDFDDIDEDIEVIFESSENLEELENALDDLEGVIDEVNNEVDEAVNEIHQEVKEAIDEVRVEINEKKEQEK